jgi:hypothetical protein
MSSDDEPITRRPPVAKPEVQPSSAKKKATPTKSANVKKEVSSDDEVLVKKPATTVAQVKKEVLYTRRADGCIVRKADGVVVRNADGSKPAALTNGAAHNGAPKEAKYIRKADGSIVRKSDGAVVRNADGTVVKNPVPTAPIITRPKPPPQPVPVKAEPASPRRKRSPNKRKRIVDDSDSDAPIQRPPAKMRVKREGGTPKRSTPKKKKVRVVDDSGDEDEDAENAAAQQRMATRRANRSKKDQLVADLLTRWWYVLPEWPPANFPWEDKLKEKKLRRVAVESFEFEPLEVSGRVKCYELSTFKGVYRDAHGGFHDLRPREGRPSYDVWAEKSESELYDLVARAIENQLVQLRVSPHIRSVQSTIPQLEHKMHEYQRLARVKV